jgi:hypothetical protein
MRKSPKTTDGVNLKSHTQRSSLTPLISALLLAGIKLALEEKKRTNGCKAAKAAKANKATASRRRKTI